MTVSTAEEEPTDRVDVLGAEMRAGFAEMRTGFAEGRAGLARVRV